MVAQDGFDRLSVRTVARAAQVSGGTVQHHYATREALLIAAFARTVQNITARLAEVDLGGPLPGALGVLCRQLLPLDEERRRECAVWTALTAAAATHPDLAAEHARALGLFLDAVAAALADAQDAGEVPAGIDPVATAAIVAAAVDGLTLHGVAGSRTGPELTATLDALLAALLTER